MESIPENAILEWPPNALNEIRNVYDLDKPGRIEEAVTILQEWIQKQNHFLKKDFSADYLERCLIFNKGSVEKTKKCIDKLCTLKKLLPIYFQAHNLKTDINNALDLGHAIMLPKMTNDFCRIVLIKMAVGKELTDKKIMESYQMYINFAEYIYAHDYINGIIVIHDYQNNDLVDVMTKVNPVLLQQYLTIINQGYRARIKAVHILTQSKTVEFMLKFLKPILTKKTYDRIFIHKTIEELHTVIPKDMLPEEYGGKEKCVEEISRDWIEELSKNEHIEYMKMMSRACTDEQLRSTDKFNDEYMGMPGAFRNLKVD